MTDKAEELRQRFPRFKKGEIVKMTEEAVRANLKGRGSLYGEVMAEPEPTRVGRMSVTVRRVNQSTRGKYWAGFWRHLKVTEFPEQILRRRNRDHRNDPVRSPIYEHTPNG